MIAFARRTIDSSVFVNGVRRAWHASRTRALAVGLRPAWIAAARNRFPDALPDATFPLTVAIVERLALVRSIERLMAAASSAWRHSAARRLLLGRVPARLEPSQRVTLAGIILAVAFTTYWRLDLAAVTDLWPRQVVAVLGLAIGATLVGASRALAAAWRDRRRAR